ncbi:hypothetical protein Arad_14027 (plasmid) [Rhizobium rhizogenes K84]|uniref:Peptidase M41 domain-containing protein n=4 Tax=Rhizobium/Agrobacterium group TaxID=227290 RepID=B9JP65_RHIR8|nr:hypothetical protein Arad_14027 [Rhizobium rhizogenes K84]
MRKCPKFYREVMSYGGGTPYKMRELRELAAYHEAGHAVAAWTQKLTIYSVSIEGNQQDAGYMIHEDSLRPSDLLFSPQSGRTRLGAERNIRVALAGEIAQKLFDPSSVEDRHGANDRLAVDTLLSALHGAMHRSLIDAHFRLLEIETKLIVSKYWSVIVAVASELLRQERLTGVRLSRVIKEATSHWRLSRDG